ncbi:unnamed protein product [Ophioblennius macclurei]
MKALLVFVVVGFVCSPAEGRTVSKCELRQQLVKAIAALSEGEKQAGLTDDNFVAKIVCHAELASQFNSSSVSELICTSGSHPGRKKRAVSYLDLLNVAGQDGRLGSAESNTQERRNPRNPASPVHVKPNSRLRYNCVEDDETWTLYGLFQLGSHLACSDGVTPSPNICGMDCINLLDDNILDDVHCLLTVFRNLV